MAEAALTPWPHADPPTDETLDQLLRDQGLSPRWWSNGPDDRYSAHSHSYDKVLYCARGSIRFDLAGVSFELRPGDRLDVPADVSHSALVGPQGVACVEAAGGLSLLSFHVSAADTSPRIEQ